MAGGLALPAAFAFGSDLDPARWWAWRRQLTESVLGAAAVWHPLHQRLTRRPLRLLHPRHQDLRGAVPVGPMKSADAILLVRHAMLCLLTRPCVGRRSCCWSASPPHCPCSSRCTPAAAASRMLRTAPSESRHARHYGRLRLSCRIQRPRHCRLRHCPRLDLLGQQLVGSSCQRARTDTPCARFRGVWGAEAFRAAVGAIGRSSTWPHQLARAFQTT